jgi:phosphonate transport system substrate-binding protein
MNTRLGIFAVSVLLTGLGALIWVTMKPAPRTVTPAEASVLPAATQPERVLRLDITPERNPVEQMRRYASLGQYLSGKLAWRVEFSVVNTYQAVLADLAEEKADGAFVGSMVGALAIDRLGVSVLVKPQTFGGVSTYRGVVFVPENSPIKSVDELAGHTLGMVRATTAGDLFPILLLREAHLLDRPDCPRLVYCGTHDDAVAAVLEGRVDAGAAKDLRLTAMLEANPAWKVRRLATSDPVPNNALILRGKAAAEVGAQLSAALLAMGDAAEGRGVLNKMGIERYVPCAAGEYGAVREMAGRLGPDWRRVGVEGPPPRPAPAGPTN